VDDPTECKVAYLAVVSHPAGETVAYLIDKFLQRRFAQRRWFAWLRSRLHFGYVVAKLPGSVPAGPLNPNSDHHRWKALLKAAGRDARLHDARHAAATMPLVLGVPQRTVTAIMGWSSTAMAAGYQHVGLLGALLGLLPSLPCRCTAFARGPTSQ
jgi:integrase